MLLSLGLVKIKLGSASRLDKVWLGLTVHPKRNLNLYLNINIVLLLSEFIILSSLIPS